MKAKQTLFILMSGVFLIFDRFFKWLALNSLNSPQLLNRWFGWRPFLNSGVAFGLPIPLIINIFLSAIIIVLLVIAIAKAKQGSGYNKLAIVLILFGAASNLYDRLTLHATVDYFQILTGVFNIADFMILLGFIKIIWARPAPHKPIDIL